MATTTEIKERGAHFTPADIANYIAKSTYALINASERKVSVLDPSCGDGELLIAAMNLLHEEGFCVRLIGVETDKETLENARRRIEPFLAQDDDLELHLADFLACRSEEDESTLFDDAAALPLIPKVDMLVANPPYVRTQVLGSEISQKLAKKYKLSGKTDLYHAFFLNYSRFVKPSGALGVITSNRYLYTKSGEQVRKHLHNSYRIHRIVDLGDTKVFSAAVLPALLFATLGSNDGKSTECVRVYEGASGEHEVFVASSIAELLANPRTGAWKIDQKQYMVECGHVRDTSYSKEPWILASERQEAWLDNIDSSAAGRILDFAKVRVGIKTTADNVFIRESWSDLPDDCSPENEWVFPLLSSGDASRWTKQKAPKLSILYPHYTDETGKRRTADIEKFPRTKAYLQSHYEQLSGRGYVIKANRKWYEIWVPQDPSAWAKPKIVFPDISNCAKFQLDDDGCLVDGNCYWIQLLPNVENDLLYLILAVANSELMDTYHALSYQNVLYSGKRRYLTQYVEKYPLPDPRCEASQRVIAYVKNALQKKQSIEQGVVDRLVYESFGVDPYLQK